MPNVDPFTEAVKAAYADAQDLLLEKHRYYGPKNIADAPGGALNGLRVRLHDKLARMNHMLDAGLETGVGESLKDTARDIANYGIIMTLVLDGDWPGAQSPLLVDSFAASQ